MGYEWVIPAAAAAYKNRNKIAESWDYLVSQVFGKKYKIAITGVSGIGKTDLFNHLMNRPEARSGTPTSTSRGTESHTKLLERQRLVVTTIPGQEVDVRTKSLGKMFGKNSDIDGIIHVVGNGYTTIRDEAIREQLLHDNPHLISVDKYRKYHLDLELEDFKELVPLLRNSSLNASKPRWLCLAATKADLFSDNLHDAEDYYRMPNKSPYAKILNDLRNDVGKYRFSWFALPVCASLEPFEWNGTTVNPKNVSESQRNAMVDNLLKRIAKECNDE